VAYTVTYPLSPHEAQLSHDVTEYVREEMNRASGSKARSSARFAQEALLQQPRYGSL